MLWLLSEQAGGRLQPCDGTHAPRHLGRAATDFPATQDLLQRGSGVPRHQCLPRQ